MIFRNLLATRNGRLVTFFFLYVTEGLPFGFTGTAIITYMTRGGLTTEQVGMFAGLLYLPWGFKWMIGPIVDVIYSPRLGRRRGWILGTQLLMSAGLIALMPVDFVHRLHFFTFALLLVNALGATQDVAIDALACGVLSERERGLANGLMFAGFYVGQSIGGAGVLLLVDYMPFKATFVFVSACILLITLLITLPLREPIELSEIGGRRFSEVGERIRGYLHVTLKAFFGTRASIAGLAFAILPAGAYALSLALVAHLAVELGMSDRSISFLTIACSIAAATACVAGGYLSDRYGRRRTLAIYLVLTILPTLYLARQMSRYGWIFPRNGASDAPSGLILAYWTASITYSIVQGLYYGTRTALFMDVCNPAVAATQFTAYMALLNVVTVYTSIWQGWAATRWGFPKTFLLDAALGMVSLLALPWMKPRIKTKEKSNALPIDA